MRAFLVLSTVLFLAGCTNSYYLHNGTIYRYEPTGRMVNTDTKEEITDKSLVSLIRDTPEYPYFSDAIDARYFG